MIETLDTRRMSPFPEEALDVQAPTQEALVERLDVAHDLGKSSLKTMVEPVVEVPEKEMFSVEDALDLKHTEDLNVNVLEKGLSIRQGTHGNVPNESVFRASFDLSPEDTRALGFYKGAGANLFNRFMRGESRTTPRKQDLATMLKLFSSEGRLPTTKGGELVFRGLPVTSADPSMELTEHGFMSTSVSAEVATDFAKSAKTRNGSGYLVRAVLPEGIKYLPSGGSEKEAVLQPGLTIVPQTLMHKGSPEYLSIIQQMGEYSASVDIDGIIDATIEARPLAT